MADKTIPQLDTTTTAAIVETTVFESDIVGGAAPESRQVTTPQLRSVMQDATQVAAILSSAITAAAEFFVVEPSLADPTTRNVRHLILAEMQKAMQGNGVAGIAAGYRVARGSASITGSSAINTGLTTLTSLTLSLAQACSSGACWVSHSMLASSGWTSAQVYALTSSGSATPVISTVASTVHWIAVGTG